MAGIDRNPAVDSGVLNSQYVRMFPTGTEEDQDAYSKYVLGDIDVASQIVRGTMTFNKDKLRELDPSYSGYTHIFVLAMPEFMKALAQGNIIGDQKGDAKKKARYHYANLKAILEMGSTSYSGTPDLQLQTSDVNVGFPEKNFVVPTYSSYDSTQFTIRCIETYGEPLRHAVEYYIEGLADPNAKYQHLHGAAVRTTQGLVPMQPSLANITFTIMAVQTDQTLHNIQDISIWTNCLITGVERGHLDWELGTIDTVQPQTLQLRGIYLPHSNAAAVQQKAAACLNKRLHYYKRLDDMSETEYGANLWDDPTAGLPD